MNMQEVSDLIVEYQRKHSMTDAQLAFASHISVEKIHGLKRVEIQVSDEELDQLLQYMEKN